MYRSLSTLIIFILSLTASLAQPFPALTPHPPILRPSLISLLTSHQYYPPPLHPRPTTMDMTASIPTRDKTTYPIPSTDLTLHLTLGLDLPLPIASIRSCLDGAIAIARSHSPLSLTTAIPFRFQQPESEKDSDAQFGIVGDPIFGTNELNWGDVVGVLKGLGDWAEQREGRGDGGVEVWFRVVEGGEQGRGQVGDGYLRRREVEVDKRSGVGNSGEWSYV